ncbi:MAG: hypothetical protein VBE63_05915 [Lamprobacter sp.]|nr:hypothetical protein [Lamprobacter sp.]
MDIAIEIDQELRHRGKGQCGFLIAEMSVIAFPALVVVAPIKPATLRYCSSIWPQRTAAHW